MRPWCSVRFPHVETSVREGLDRGNYKFHASASGSRGFDIDWWLLSLAQKIVGIVERQIQSRNILEISSYEGRESLTHSTPYNTLTPSYVAC